ncbi:MAG: hypothetical protein C0448_14425 [Sphingobacteriaceae bacterium]|nr:hypothetical protein [Sphingobacteriaceae bacterium]
MNSVFTIFFVLLILSSGVICIQDLKERFVSLWILLVFGFLTVSSVLYYKNVNTLLINLLGTIIYGSFIWLVLKLYMLLKFKRNRTILNSQLGMADVLIFLFIGLTLNTIGMILFFCFGFLFSLFGFIMYSTLNKNIKKSAIPLAGLLVLFYVITIIVFNFFTINTAIDCSFISV